MAGPIAVTYGFADTWRNTTPTAITKVPKRNTGKECNLAAGIKIKLPIAIRIRPAITVILYPILSIILPVGTDIKGYAIKNADDNNCAPNSDNPNIALTGAVSVTMKVVAKPKMKKIAPKTEMPKKA